MKTKLLFPVLFSAMLILAACGTKSVTPAGTLPPISGGSGATTEVTIQSYTFTPAEINIKVGETVTWTNLDSVAHTVVADDASWGSGQLNKGDKFSYTFSQPGTYAYRCGVHPTMTGKVIVSP